MGGVKCPAAELGGILAYFDKNTQNVNRAFRVVRGKAKIDILKFYDLRHPFATRLVQSGKDIYKVKTFWVARDLQ